MAKFLITMLCAFLLTLSVRAEAAEAGLSLSTEDGVDGSIDIGADDDDVLPWDKARYFEFNPRTQYQFALAKPDELGGGYAFMGTFDARYCWSYMSGVACPGLRQGIFVAHGSDNTTGESLVDASYVFQPSFFHGNYIAERWIISETLSLPLIDFDEPGIQLDVGASYMHNKWLAVEFGVSLSYLQTNLLAAGEEANMAMLGPYFALIFEPWGQRK